MLKKTLAITTISLIFSTNVFAKVDTYPAGSFCKESILKKNTAVNKFITSNSNFDNAMKRVVTEQVGADIQGYGFLYNPSFERSSREFVCNIPLNDDVGKFKLNLHAELNNMKPGRPGGCSFAKIRRVNDGAGWKVFSYGLSGGFTWTDLTQNGGFVHYSQYIDNKYERSTSLQVKCRTTSDQGSILLHHIELEY